MVSIEDGIMRGVRIGKLGKEGAELSSGYWLKGEWRGPRSCFYISPFSQGRHDGATGMDLGLDPTPRSARQFQLAKGTQNYNLLNTLQFGLLSPEREHPHMNRPTFHTKRGWRKMVICSRNCIQIQIQAVGGTCSVATYVYTYHVLVCKTTL